MKTLKLTTEEGKTYKAILTDLDELSTSKMNEAFDIQYYEEFWTLAVEPKDSESEEIENLEFRFETFGATNILIPIDVIFWSKDDKEIKRLNFEVKVK